MTNSTHKWDRDSDVTACPSCKGTGWVAASRRPTIDDPYPESPCPDCDGPQKPSCPVCGYDLEVAGYDCLACETIAALPKAVFDTFDLSAFAVALGRAMVARWQSEA